MSLFCESDQLTMVPHLQSLLHGCFLDLSAVSRRSHLKVLNHRYLSAISYFLLFPFVEQNTETVSIVL